MLKPTHINLGAAERTKSRRPVVENDLKKLKVKVCILAV